VDSLGEKNGQGGTAELSAALDSMWTKFLPEIRHRAQVLEDAARSAAAGKLSQAQRDAALGAAHKLAGTLGTFGLGRGTRLARELEQMFAAAGPVPAERLARMAAEVQAIIESRK
jgi:HPt (histidine-containing phosphotransfer) domain-containing protein